MSLTPPRLRDLQSGTTGAVEDHLPKTHESGQKEIVGLRRGHPAHPQSLEALMAEFNRKYGGHIGFAAQCRLSRAKVPLGNGGEAPGSQGRRPGLPPARVQEDTLEGV